MAESVLAPFEKLDPTDAWKPWQPDGKNPWNLKWAGHLLRRATFGSSLAELRQAVKLGLPATLDRLLEGDPQADKRLDFLLSTGKLIADQNNAASLRPWWLYAMLHSLHPLREKLTLFWHDHFATSINKVTSAALMFKQNATLRQNALGKLEPFLQTMSKDPAMLVWLDSNSNVKGKPNENYARELMELFSLGVRGGYTEKDIREAARAFTGWHTDEGQFTFDASQHDAGEKTILNQKGKLNGDDVVRICVKHPSCARFICAKLYRFYVSDAETPPDSFLDPLAEAFRKSDHDIKALVRQILSSRHFYSTQAYRQRIKSPTELAVGAVWALTSRQIPQAALVPKLEDMGQSLFAPPNVKGWPGGTSWLNTSTVLARHNFAQMVATGNLKNVPVRGGGGRFAAIEEAREAAEQAREEAIRAEEEARRKAEEEKARAEGKPIPPPPAPPPQPPPPPPPANLDVAALIRQEKADTPEAAVALLLDVLLQGDVNAAARAKLVAFLKKGDPKGVARERRIRETAHMIMTMPEYQLC